MQSRVVEKDCHTPEAEPVLLTRLQIATLQTMRARIRAARAPLEAMGILIGALEAMVAPGIALSPFELGEVRRVTDHVVALATQQHITALAEAGLRLQTLIDELALLPAAPTAGIALQLPVLRRLAARF
jgi:hypothetical protein